MPDEPSQPASVSSSPRLPLHTNRYNIKNVAYSSAPRHTLMTTITTSGGPPGEIHRADLKISDVANLLDDDWIPLARNLGVTDPDIAIIEAEYPSSPHQQVNDQYIYKMHYYSFWEQACHSMGLVSLAGHSDAATLDAAGG
jgi:hypothetical protein